MKVAQVYAPTSSHGSEEVERFHEDVESASRKVKTLYTVLMGDFNTKVGKKPARDPAVGEHSIGTRDNKKELLIELEEQNNLRILNTFFLKRKNRMWTWKSPNARLKMEEFILCSHPGIVHDVDVIGKVRCSYHPSEIFHAEVHNMSTKLVICRTKSMIYRSIGTTYHGYGVIYHRFCVTYHVPLNKIFTRA